MSSYSFWGKLLFLWRRRERSYLVFFRLVQICLIGWVLELFCSLVVGFSSLFGFYISGNFPCLIIIMCVIFLFLQLWLFPYFCSLWFILKQLLSFLWSHFLSLNSDISCSFQIRDLNDREICAPCNRSAMEENRFSFKMDLDPKCTT